MENIQILVSAQSDKATGYVACATHRLGQLRSPDLPPDDNRVFLDRARRAAGAKQQFRLRPQSDVGDGDPGSQDRPFVKRDLSRFSVSERPFLEKIIGNRFWETGGLDGSRRDRSGDCPAIGSFSGKEATVR